MGNPYGCNENNSLWFRRYRRGNQYQKKRVLSISQRSQFDYSTSEQSATEISDESQQSSTLRTTTNWATVHYDETVSMKTKGNFIEQWTTLSTLLNKETGNPLGETRSVYKLETYSSST